MGHSPTCMVPFRPCDCGTTELEQKFREAEGRIAWALYHLTDDDKFTARTLEEAVGAVVRHHRKHHVRETELERRLKQVAELLAPVADGNPDDCLNKAVQAYLVASGQEEVSCVGCHQKLRVAGMPEGPVMHNPVYDPKLLLSQRTTDSDPDWEDTGEEDPRLED